MHFKLWVQWILLLSSLLTFAVVILWATGSNTMALPLLVLPSGFGSGVGTASLDIVL